MNLADREDLPHVMFAVYEMKPTPLKDAEGAEDVVACATRRTEELFRLIEEGVEALKMFGC